MSSSSSSSNHIDTDQIECLNHFEYIFKNIQTVVPVSFVQHNDPHLKINKDEIVSTITTLHQDKSNDSMMQLINFFDKLYQRKQRVTTTYFILN